MKCIFTPKLLLFACCAGVLALAACSKTNEPDPTLSLSTKTATLTAAGDAQRIEVTTNQADWKASLPAADSWCILKQEGSILQITAQPQTAITPRTTQVTITAGALTALISVTQAGENPLLSVDKEEVSLTIDGAAVTVAVTTNLDTWSASRPSADSWCTLATTGNTLSISATLCTVAERTTTVTVVAGTLTQPISVTQKGGVISYEVSIPTEFSECAVKKALYNQEKVAEICFEYIRSQNAQMTVIYPVIDGKADLTRGIESSTGGAIVWDIAANTCTYTPGSATNLSKVWIEDGQVKTTATESGVIVAATISPDLLVDVRGASSEIYKIVKIGTQYWMAENLRAERYLDGSAISEDWKNNTTGAYIYLYNSAVDNKAIFGALYNGFATYNTAGLAPQNWDVPNNAAWSKLRTYIGTPYGTKLKSIDYWKVNKGTNIIGFDARPAQNYSLDTGFTDPIETWFWSKDVTYDALFKSDSQFYVRLVDSNTGMTFNPDKSFGSFHTQAFGHSVRCIRK